MTGDPLARPPVPPLEGLATMARTLADDGWLPVAERTMAAVVGARLRQPCGCASGAASRVGSAAVLIRSTGRMSEIEVIDVRRLENAGNVRAFISLRIGGITIHDAKIVQQPGQRPWLAMPDRQWQASDGKTRYAAIIAVDVPKQQMPAVVRARL